MKDPEMRGELICGVIREPGFGRLIRLSRFALSPLRGLIPSGFDPGRGA